METLVLGWYIIAETGDAFQTGLIGALRFGGTLLAPFYGVMADRVNRRNMLVGMRLVFAAQSAVMMALALTGVIQPWHAFVLAFLAGLIRQAEQVVRQSLIADTVPRESIMNAAGLARTTQDLSRIAGSFLGAGLLSGLGLGQAYIGVTCFFTASALLALGITLKEGQQTLAKASPVENLRTGVAYMRRDRTIVAVMFLAFLVNLTTFPLTNGLMPVVAKEVYGLGPNGLASLIAVSSAGALAGSMALASLSARAGRADRMMMAGIVLWHVTLLAFVFTDRLGLALAVLAVHGAMMSVSMVAMSTLLLETTAAEFRGRVMGVRMLAVYGLPMGLLLGGWLSNVWDVQAALLVLAIVGLLMTAAALVLWPELWRSRTGVAARGRRGN
jgi:MFS family permease